MGIKKKIAYKVSELYNLGLDKHERDIVDSVLSSTNFGKPIKNEKPKAINNIAFLTPGLDRYSGGVTSILRLGSNLVELGYNVNYIDVFNTNIQELEANASLNLNNFKGKIVLFKEANRDGYDVIIATNWQTVYYVNDFNAYKMYFVQDFEPYFFKLNERYLLAKLTYELGLHIVSLGKWNIEEIKKECNTVSVLDNVSFPYEPSEYETTKKRDYSEYKGKNKFKLAVYTKEEGKRIPNILQSILADAENALSKEGIQLDILFFGLKKSYKTKVGKNLGKLNKEELRKLYNECDFGMVASMTNISLVPYEMIATGLPIIEFSAGSFPTFFSRNAAILIDYDSSTLVKELLTHIRNPRMIEEMMKEATLGILGLSWKKTAGEFASILNGCIQSE